MSEASSNESDIPPYARLAAGLTGEDLHNAITRSGYPFQAVIADRLRSALEQMSRSSAIQEEWPYIDDESGHARTVDIYARIFLGPKGGADADYPALNLVVECKQSELPYVFFLRESAPNGVQLLRVAGSKNGMIRLVDLTGEADEDPKPRVAFHMPIHDVFSAYDLPFFDTPAPWAISLSKAVRKPKVELTGEEAYRSLTLPLLKAVKHLEAVSIGPDGKDKPFLITFCVVVARAPLIGVTIHEEQPHLVAMPWYRVTHVEPDQGGPRIFSNTARYYDVVHECFFDEYVTKLMESMDELAERMKGHREEVATGLGAFTMSSEEENEDEGIWKTLVPMSEDETNNLESKHQFIISRQIGGLSIRPQSNEQRFGQIAVLGPLPDEFEMEGGDESSREAI
ncbi:hypothetical protein ACFWM1_00395 [Nocardia sp. NPDC058379]|uniref:hypothetical protein n=1 Tax=unclassified Nocardia TaxID=2637762 RepID=UPI00364733CC